jgi:phosphatidylglycerophosphatase A
MPADARDQLRQTTGTLLLTVFGLGTVPWMPGTVTSLAVVGLLGLGVGHASAWAQWALCGLVLLYGTAVTLRFASAAVDARGRGDPSWVVSDEVAGQALACAFVVPFGFSWPALASAFVLFRLFDILKPGLRRFERLPGGVGVLMDDVAAGLLAGAAVAIGCGLELIPGV